MAKATTVTTDAKAIRSMPNVQWVLSSDSGQINNLPPPEALLSFVKHLIDNGISKKEINTFIQKNPKRLFYEV